MNEKPSVAAERNGLWLLNAAPLRMKLRYFWRRILQVRATPHEVALGFAVGVFALARRFSAFRWHLAFALAFLLRVSIPAALLGTFIGNPLSWPAIWSASYIAGALGAWAGSRLCSGTFCGDAPMRSGRH